MLKINQVRKTFCGENPMVVDGKVESVRIGIAAAGVTIWGYTLNEWVAIITIIYLVLQCLILMPKIYCGIRAFFLRSA